MPLPAPYTGRPGEEPHHYYRNLCLHFIKLIKTTQDIPLLEEEMERLIDASHQMRWPREKSTVYHVDEGEKALQRVYREFKRYIETLKTHPENAHKQDLLDALVILEQMIASQKVR